MFDNWQKLVSSNKIGPVHEKITYYIGSQVLEQPGSQGPGPYKLLLLRDYGSHPESESVEGEFH